jgi:hypothetical protein
MDEDELQRCATAPLGSPSAAAEIDWDKIRQDITDVVASDATEIIKALSQKAKEGHLQAAKFLFALAGFFPQRADRSGVEDCSLARFLCDHLGLPPAPETIEGQIVTPENRSSPRGNGHALK